jgi:hypothetical protein
MADAERMPSGSAARLSPRRETAVEVGLDEWDHIDAVDA